MIKKIILTLLFFGALPTVQAEPAVGFGAVDIQTRVGKIFTTDIVITGFPLTEGGGVSLVYDPNSLRVLGVTLNSGVWDFVNHPGVTDNANGVISDILFSSYNGVSGDAIIATVSFKALTIGESTLTLAESSANPFAGAGQRIAPSFTSSNVSIARASLGGCYGSCHR